jgi:hypothetical protein
MIPRTPATALVSVCDQHRHCAGHILHRGRCGWEAYDHNDRSIGLFKSQDEAAQALLGDTTVALPDEP